MTQPQLDWSRTPDAEAIPVQPGSHTSWKAAVWLARQGARPLKIRRLLEAYDHAGASGLNDSEAHTATALPRSSICSLRKSLRECGLIDPAGERPGAYGIAQRVWVVSTRGRAALHPTERTL